MKNEKNTYAPLYCDLGAADLLDQPKGFFFTKQSGCDTHWGATGWGKEQGSSSQSFFQG